MSNNKEFTYKFLSDTIKEALKGFDGDELAYLSIQCKNELQIRDKIAWLMHKKIGRSAEMNVYDEVNNLGQAIKESREYLKGLDEERRANIAHRRKKKKKKKNKAQEGF